MPTWLTPSSISIPYTGAASAVDLGAYDLKVYGLTIGRGSGSNITFNTAFGRYALENNTTGEGNTATGAQALQNNTTGQYNNANGHQTLRHNTLGSNNTANGALALQWNTTGANNIAAGYAALKSNTEGYSNAAFGGEALTSNTTGFYNTALGKDALRTNIAGLENTGVGLSSLYSNNGGSYNTAIGSSSLDENTSGVYNTAMGRQALSSTTTGSNNAAVGAAALNTNTTGSNNTAIGYAADVATAALSNATAIGAGAIVSTINTIQLGNTAVTNVNTSGAITAAGFTSTIATGTAPLVVTSTTPVANLSIGGNAATVTTNAILTGPVTSVGNATTITDGAITTSKIATGAVATASIADGAITNAKVTDVAATKITGTLPVANGGTGQNTYTDGQLLIGNSSGNTLTKATLTAGAGISVTNGNGAITIASTNGLPSVNSAGDMLYWSGSAWEKVSVGANGQVLTLNNGLPTWSDVDITKSITNPVTGKVWMDRNLGASQVATSSTDALAYGDLYQWGRGTDGHQLRNSGVTATESITDTPGNNLFIASANIASGNTAYGDWRSSTNNSLWQGVGGTNNPCPSGYRIPTETEWNNEIATWTSRNSGGAFASPLKLTLGGERSWASGSISNATTYGEYWSSTVYIDSNSNNVSKFVVIGTTNVYNYDSIRAFGFSVRCIKN